MAFKSVLFSLIVAPVFQVIYSEDSGMDWWKNTVIYQVYPRSFKDSNADGIGDLRGIQQKAPYFAETGIGAVWISPIFKSPMADMGYDVSDYKDIDPLFGTLEDFDALVETLKSLNVKILLDFVPNHSSDEHEWFKKSVKKIDPYTDYYIWQDPKGWNDTEPIPPNNWVSVFAGSAWKYVPERKQFYYHAFLDKQPDLNYSNKDVVEEMKNSLRFWLDRKVDGFRVDAINFLFEDEALLDEPVLSNNQIINGSFTYSSLDHIYTRDLPKTYEIVHEFRKVADSYAAKDGQTRILLTEAYASFEKTMQYYGNSTYPVAHIPFNFYLFEQFNSSTDALALQKAICTWLDHIPEGGVSNWVLGNHDQSRVASRLDPSLVDGVNMLLMLLPGVAVTYNGDELGMTDTKMRWDQIQDSSALNVGPELGLKTTRDVVRTPFQWDKSIHAGFSQTNNKTWLPVNPNYWRINLEDQKTTNRSHYNIYKSLIHLRSNKVIQEGDLTMYIVSDWVLAFKRSMNNGTFILVMINLGSDEELIDMVTYVPDIPKTLQVLIPSMNSDFKPGDRIRTDDAVFRMRPKSSMVITNYIKAGSKN